MLENLIYRLEKIKRDIDKQEKEYLWAVTWGNSTRVIVLKLTGLKAEEELLNDLINRLQKQVS